MNKPLNSNVGERINDTKKEIAQLSEELERLIKSNANLNRHHVECDKLYEPDNANEIKSIPVDLEKTHKTSTKVGPVNTDARISGKEANPSATKNKINPGLICSKNVTHNKEATREYMRQQREKREELRKKTDSKSKIDLELKKQKLQELQQKSLALVQRNLQLKRERSKSRDRNQQIRIDNSKPNGTHMNVTAKKISNLPPKVLTKREKESAIQHLKTKDHKGNDKVNKNNSNISQKHSTSDENLKIENSKKDPGNILCNTDLDVAARKIQLFYKNYRLKKKLESKKKMLEHQTATKTKETQTSVQKQIEFPKWLQPLSVDPYPCNFINTVKKKLQLVVNTPVKSKDIGIQSSLIESKNALQKPREQSPKFNDHPKFENNSQKETNLDAEALQHFALINNLTDKISHKDKEIVGTDSESDTSKNIPEISTESGLVTNEKLLDCEKHDSILSINSDKLKNLTLRRPANENISKQSYTFKFSEDTDSGSANVTLENMELGNSNLNSNLRSPRDSIISFNISNEMSPSTSHISESIIKDEIRTEKSPISEKQHSKKKLFMSSKGSPEVQKSDYEKNIVTTRSSGKTSSFNMRDSSNEILVKTRSVLDNNDEEIKSSLSSSHNSENSVQRDNKLMKKQKNSEKYGEALKSVKNSTFLDKTSKTSDKHINSSTHSLISTISSKSSDPLSSRVEKNDVKFPDKVPILTLSNSFSTNKTKSSNSTHQVSSDLSEVDSSRKTVKISEMVLSNPSNNSGNDANFTNEKMSSVQKICEPKSDKETLSNKHETSVVKDFKSRVVQSKSDTNEIHLKFEAEVHLLNDFNESLKQFMAVERAFESIKSKNENSFRNSSKNSSGLIFPGDNKFLPDLSKHIGSTINTSRGSELDESSVDHRDLVDFNMKSSDNLELSSMQKNTRENDSFSFNENISNLAGLSIKMFEQFIKDEDIRIENLKTIIKIREQALLDRTKGELAWLEIQRKHLKETGKLHEASLVKKKQRGILLKHQQERREMQRLKQLQKIQSNERKTILKEQKNLIKAKLTSEKLLSEMKIQTSRKRKSSGPLKVLKASESLSETSISRMASEAEEIFSITSRSRSVQLSEVDSSREIFFKHEETGVKKFDATENIDKMQKALLVRQASLTKRREVLEDLLKRHQKLLEEEKKIKELEMAAKAIIMQLPATSSQPKIKSQLKEIKQKVAPLVDDKFLNEASQMECPMDKASGKKLKIWKGGSENLINKSNNSHSDSSFNTFYDNAISTISKMHSNSKKDNTNLNSSFEKKSSIDYSEDFELEKTHIDTESNENNLSSISELIEDFTQIEHGISMFSKNFDRIADLNNKIDLDKMNDTFNSENKTEETSSDLKSTEISHSEKLQKENQKNVDFETSNATDGNHHPSRSAEPETSESSSPIPSVILSGGTLNSGNVPSELPESNGNQSGGGMSNAENISSSEIKNEKLISFENIETENASLGNNSLSEIIIPNISISFVSEHSKSQDQALARTVTDEIPKNHVSDILISTKLTSSSMGVQLECSSNENNENIPPTEIFPEVKIDVNEFTNNDLFCKTDDHSNPDYNLKMHKALPASSSNLKSEELFTEPVLLSMEKSFTSKDDENTEQDESLSENISVVPTLIFSKKDMTSTTKVQQSDSSDYDVDENMKIDSSPKDETYKDIPSIKNNSEFHISEINLDDTTSKNISVIDELLELDEIKDNIEYNLEFRDEQQSNKTLDTAISNVDSSIISENIQKELDVDDAVNNELESNKRDKIEVDSISENLKSDEIEIASIETAKVSEDDDEESSSEENKLSDEINDIIKKSTKDDSSTNSYSDDFEDDKEEISSIQGVSNETDNSKMKIDDHKASDDDNQVLMVKIDLKMDSSANEAEIVIINESNVVPTQQKFNETNESKVKSPIQQRVSQILANTVGSQKSPRDKSTRYQDYYITTYEDITPVNSPESVSPVKTNQLASINTFNNEAEELLKKQLAIELEIKHLEQQQKEQLPFVYIREIPNKPPPPYTPPSTQNNTTTILPTREDDLKEICRYSAKVLYNAYLSNNLHGVTFSESDFKIINSTKSSKECCLFVFDLCREITENHYKRFQNRKEPAWLKLPQEAHLIFGKPYTYHQLENHIHIKVREMLGFEKPIIKENSVMRWSKKKKDHVDEILVLEAKAEDKEWLNYDRDELMVKNEVTDAIFDIILSETVEIYKNIFS